MRIRQSLPQPYIPGEERWSPGRCSDWELEFRDYGAIPGRGLLLTVERWIEGRWGRRWWEEMSTEESRAAMEARRYSWVTCSGWSHHHSVSPHTHQHPQLNNRKPGQLILNYRVGPHPGCSFMCPTHQSTEKDPRQEKLSAWMGGAERPAKEAFRWPDTRGSKKDSDRAISPAVEAVRVPALLVPSGSP